MKRRHLPLTALLLAGCNTTAPPPEEPQGPVLWPSPPEPARFLLEATLRRSVDIGQPAEDASLSTLLGVVEGRGVGFSKPFDVAAWGGSVYVTDTVARLVHVFNVPQRRYFQFGYRREGTLSKPLGVAVDRRGLVYVADVTARRVVVYDRLGLWQRFIGVGDELARPTGVAASSTGDRVYVVDAGGVESEAHRVMVYDGAGQFLQELGRRGSGDGEFNLPTAAAVAGDGSLYVLDGGNFRIQVFDREGRLLRQFGELGNGPGQLARPRGLAVGDDGLVYVSDAAFGNVQVFDPTGRLLLAIGSTSDVDRPGRYALPAGIEVDETNRLYLLDQLFLKLDVIRRLPERSG